jgi:hypothetical protein
MKRGTRASWSRVKRAERDRAAKARSGAGGFEKPKSEEKRIRVVRS